MDKGLTRFTKGRGRVAIITMVCLVALLALPAVAHAASFAGEWPAPSSTLHNQPGAVSVNLIGAGKIKTAKITVGTQVLTAAVIPGSSTGTWSSTESLGGDGKYHTHWTFTPGSTTAVTTLMVSPSALAPGAVAVSVAATDTLGAAYSDSWSFTMAAQPVVVGYTSHTTELSAMCWACHQGFFDDSAMGEDCLECHDVNYGPAAGVTADHIMAYTGPVNAEAWDGHKIADTALSAVDGVPSGLTWESEIASASLNSTWQTNLGVSSLTVGQEGAVVTQWKFPTVNVFWGSSDASAPAGATTGLTASSTIGCTDCHNTSGVTWGVGPHGAVSWGFPTGYTANWKQAELTKFVVTAPSGVHVRTTPDTFTLNSFTGLISTCVGDPSKVGQAPYTSYVGSGNAVVCEKCHDLENFKSGTTYTTTSTFLNAGGKINTGGIGASNTAHASHHQDQVDGSPLCINCHVGIPHGWTRPRLLVNTDVDPYPINSAVGTTRTTSTGEKETGNTIGKYDGTGFNGQGMQSLSGWDQHTLSYGAAAWTEASCQACGDHAGEDGVRIKEEE